MIPVVRKAVKILMDETVQQRIEDTKGEKELPLVAAMRILETQLEKSEWKDLMDMGLMTILETITVRDIIELAKE